MFYAQSENKYIRPGTQFTLDGVTYPAQWLYQSTLEQKQEIGLEEVITVGERKSDEFYWVSEQLDGVTLTYVNTPKDLDTVKGNLTNKAKDIAYSTLQPTDYIDIRNLRDPEYKPEWIVWRDSVRQTVSDYISQVQAAETIEQLEALNLQLPDSPDSIAI